MSRLSIGIENENEIGKPDDGPSSNDNVSNDDVSFLGNHLVLYTDGGCRPSSRGYGGSGIHGYVFDETVPKQGSGAKQQPTANGYTDEKVTPVNVLQYVDAWYSSRELTTNNTAELLAAIKAFDLALDLKAKSLLLLMDSKYTLEGLENYVDKWVRNGWRTTTGEPVKNKELWIELLDIRNRFTDTGAKLRIEHVKGHNGDLGNTIADAHATKGVFLHMQGTYLNKLELSAPRGYWNPKETVNRMLSKASWYFSTNTDQVSTYRADDGRHIYFMGDHGNEDRFINKKTSDSSYAVVYLKEKDLVLEEIRHRQASLTQGSTIVIGRMPAIRQPKSYDDISRYGGVYLMPNPKNPLSKDLENSYGVQITKGMEPAMLAWRSVEILEQLDDILNSYLKGEELYLYTDITDAFYTIETSAKGKVTAKIRSNLGTGASAITVKAKVGSVAKHEERDIKLLFDMDLPSRNALSAIASPETKVFMVSWAESEEAFRYATIVDNGVDCGVWSTVTSNLKLLKSK